MPLILVIEDDSTQRLLTSSVLRSAGYEVVEAQDGTEGLKLARQSPPDLVVCDVVMPGMNGYELVASLKQEAAFATVPVILLTAMSERSHMRAGMTAGADDYLHKPFRAVELRKAVETLLSKRELQRVQFARAGKTAMIAALEQQKESLAHRYEKRLAQELNDRWVEQTGHESELAYPHATVLFVNLFETIVRHQPLDRPLGSVTQRVYQAASDSLYLFGAQHLVPAGDDLLAVFPEPVASDAGRTRLLALRAAFGMQKMVQAALESVASPGASNSGKAVPAFSGLTISLHTGPMSLLTLQDPLHGGQSLTLAVGETVQAVKSLGRQARGSQWGISCSAAVARGLTEWVTIGEQNKLASESFATGLEVMELLAAAPT